MATSRGDKAIAAATAIHVAALLLTRAMPLPPPSPEIGGLVLDPVSLTVEPISIEAELGAADVHEAGRTDAPAVPQRERKSKAVVRLEPSVVPSSEKDIPDPRETAQAVADRGSPGWTLFPAGEGSDPLRNVRARGSTLPAMAQVTGPTLPDADRAAPRSTSGGVAEGLDELDFTRGMGRGGPVLAAVESASHGDDAPGEGSATIDVTIDRAGLVVAHADSEAWSGVAAAVANEMKHHPVRIAPTARGLRVVVRVEAVERFVNGAPAKGLGTKLTLSPGALSGNPGEQGPIRELPGIHLTGRSKVCGYDVGLTILGPVLMGGCSLENIGTPALRVVRAHIVREERF